MCLLPWELNCQTIEIICICVDCQLCLGRTIKDRQQWSDAVIEKG